MSGDHCTDVSLLNLGKLTPAVIKLITATEKAIGGIFKPMQIRRVARAKADAILIAAEADAKKQEIAYRAAGRIAYLEVQRQTNIESIIKEAAKVVPENVTDDPVDPDWMSYFFDECKDVGNTEVQEIWGKLLAGEVEKPGTFSRKAMSILKTLSSNDARLFKQFCSMMFLVDHEPGVIAPLYDRLSRSLSSHMDPLGLVMNMFDVVEGERLERICYWDKHYKIVSKTSNPTARMIAVKRFSPAGVELARLVARQQDDIVEAVNLSLIKQEAELVPA